MDGSIRSRTWAGRGGPIKVYPSERKEFERSFTLVSCHYAKNKRGNLRKLGAEGKDGEGEDDRFSTRVSSYCSRKNITMNTLLGVLKSREEKRRGIQALPTGHKPQKEDQRINSRGQEKKKKTILG